MPSKEKFNIIILQIAMYGKQKINLQKHFIIEIYNS